MPSFTVTEVSDKVRSYDTEHGAKKAYRVHLRNGDGTDHLNIELRRNATSSPPSVGQALEGDLIDQGQYGQYLKVAYGGGGGGSRPEDLLRQKRIVRQHSQNMALQAVRLAFEQSLYHEAQPANPEELRAFIKKWTDWFDADVERAES